MTACSSLARTQALRSRSMAKPGHSTRLVAYVRTGSRWFRRKFKQACHHLRLTAREVTSASVELSDDDRQELGIPVRGNQTTSAPWLTVYVVSGTREALAEFVRRPCVQAAHPVLPARVAYRGTGSGEKPQPRPRPRQRRKQSTSATAYGGATLLRQLPPTPAAPERAEPPDELIDHRAPHAGCGPNCNVSPHV